MGLFKIPPLHTLLNQNTTELFKLNNVKKILTALAVLITSSLIAQNGAIFHLALATSTKAKVMVDGGFGYMYHNASVEGSIIAAPLDQAEDHPAYFAANAGYKIDLYNWSITPMIGTAYRMQSMDKTYLNGFVPSIGMRIKFKDCYLGVSEMDKTMIVSVGIAGLIND